jgi:uncharacterized protein YjbI with pentapeptide repeats
MQENYYEEQIIKDKKYENITKEQYKFIDCTFENCSFEECEIINCVFVNCNFYNCNIISLTSKYSEVKLMLLFKNAILSEYIAGMNFCPLDDTHTLLINWNAVA